MSTIPHFQLLSSPLRGRNLLEASAGTGKTFTIAALYLRLLLETDLTVEKILVVTFTEAATEELRDRIRRRIHQALAGLEGAPPGDDFLAELLAGLADDAARQTARQRLREALVCFDEAAVHTIHGFCQRVLQDQAFEAGSLFDTEVVTNQAELVAEIARDFLRRHCVGLPGAFADYLVEQKVTPTVLTDILGQAAGDPEMQVLPSATAPELEAPSAAWQAAREALQACWAEERETIRSLVIDSSTLNGNKYRADSRRAWLDEIDAYLQTEQVFTAPAALTEKFTAVALEKGTRKGQDPPRHRFFDLCQVFAERHAELESLFAAALTALKARFIAHLRRDLPARKRASNLRHFDDLLLDVRQRLATAAGARLRRAIRKRFQAAFIDEFQDTDPVQFAIFQGLYSDASFPVFYIGDPKQAIYSFRGADIFAYIDATRAVERRYTLATNWRSTPALVKAVNRLFDRHQRPFVFRDIPFSPVKPKPDDPADRLVEEDGGVESPLRFWHLSPADPDKPDTKELARQRLADAVAAEAGRLLDRAGDGRLRIGARPLRAGDLAVLVRTHKEAALIEGSLRAAGIPCVRSGTGSLFHSREAGEMLGVLRAIADPVDESRLKAALGSDLFGLEGRRIAALDQGEKELEVWLDKFSNYNRIWQIQGVIAMTGALLSAEQVRPRLLAFVDGPRRLTNLLHCCEVLHRAAQEQHLGIDGLLTWFARQFDEPQREEYEIRLESDDNAVQIVTIHKSKGLEYPVVFCPFCWNQAEAPKKPPLLFHDPAAAYRRTMDIGSPDFELHRSVAEPENLAEQMRLLYVAVTRARYRCYLGWGELNGAEGSALGYLLHAPLQAAAGTGSDALLPPVTRPTELDGAQITGVLAQLSAETDGLISSTPLPEPGVEGSSREQPAAAIDLAAPKFDGAALDRSWRVSSFSALTATVRSHRDLPDPEDLPLANEGPDPFVDEPPVESFASFLDFPKGPVAGTCLHQLFETINFAGRDPAATDRAIAAALAAYGFDARWQPAVRSMVDRTLATPLVAPDGESFALDRVAANQRLTEMEFFLPLAPLESGRLAAVFAAHDRPATPTTGFAAHLATLGFQRHHGLLQGFIDLVFRHAGRYYLLDWKSNHLGREAAAYRPEALVPAMQRSYYTLQYHLYLVALHRHLAQTLPDYSYDRHFGGVFYLYLRGTALNGNSGDAWGVFRDRPDRGLVEALAACLVGAEEAA